MSNPDFPETLGLKRRTLNAQQARETLDLEKLSPAELYALRDRIDGLLPSAKLKDMDMEQEITRQFQRVRALQDAVAEDDSVPANQQAQVANSVTGLLKELVKLQSDIYNADQFRKMEACLAHTLKNAPEDFREAFFKQYEKTAEEMANG